MTHICKHPRRALRQLNASMRQRAHNDLTPQARLAKLDKHAHVAKREREKLAKLIKEARS